MWSGAANAIPTGYVLCDGQNSTPDLRNRFVIGAGDTFAVDATGGSANAVVVEHTHTLTDPGHSHSYSRAESIVQGSAETSSQQQKHNIDYGTNTTQSQFTGISVDSQGESGTDKNLPPYYALCYIMKT